MMTIESSSPYRTSTCITHTIWISSIIQKELNDMHVSLTRCYDGIDNDVDDSGDTDSDDSGDADSDARDDDNNNYE